MGSAFPKKNSISARALGLSRVDCGDGTVSADGGFLLGAGSRRRPATGPRTPTAGPGGTRPRPRSPSAEESMATSGTAKSAASRESPRRGRARCPPPRPPGVETCPRGPGTSCPAHRLPCRSSWKGSGGRERRGAGGRRWAWRTGPPSPSTRPPGRPRCGGPRPAATRALWL